MPIQIKQEIHELLPVGDYPATIVDIEATDGFYGQQLQFTYNIADGQHAGAIVKAWCSAKFSTRSKLYGWTRAAFGGADIPADYTFNSDHLLNRRVVLTIIQQTKEDGTEFNRVQAVKPFRPAGNGQAPAAAAPAAQQPAGPPAAPAALPFDGNRPPAEVDDIPF